MCAGVVAGCLIAAVLVVAQPAPSRAISAIPDEFSIDVGGQTRAAIVGDVDGDGVRELVRILSVREGSRLAVEVLSVATDASLVIAGEPAVLRRGADPEDAFDSGPPPDRDNMLPLVPGQPHRLLAWRRDGVERVIAAVAGTIAGPRLCCLTIWEVILDSNGVVGLQLLANPLVAASSIWAVDLDGDGTDELVTTAPPDAIRPDEVLVRVLRWQDGEFVSRSAFLSPALGSALVSLGDSDGRPGEELGMVAAPEEAASPPLLHRISLDDVGAVRSELGVLPFLGVPTALPGAAGPIVLASPGEGLALLRWPAGGLISVEASTPQRGVPIGVLGSRTDARLLLRDGGVLHVVDHQLRRERTIHRSLAAASFRNSARVPYEGALRGGLFPGDTAFVFRGQLVMEAGDGGQNPLEDRPMAALPGLSPIGLFGPEGAWMALAEATEFDAAPEGGPLALEPPVVRVAMRVVRTSDVLRAEMDDGRLEPTVTGAIHGGRASGRPLLLANGAFEVDVAGPIRTTVVLEGADSTEVELVIGNDGVVELPISGENERDGLDEHFRVQIQAVTPAGHGYQAQWDVQILRVPPQVRVSTPVAPLSFKVPLTGRTEPGATVRVEGVPVVVEPNGSFSAELSAGVFPRDVRIAVSDAVGNSTTRTVSVVGFVDYRRLPWILVVATLTLSAAVILYLRVPRPSRPAARSGDDDATFEEID